MVVVVGAAPCVQSARRVCGTFSFSYSEVVSAMVSRRSSQRSSIASLPPAPSSMIVSSFEIVTFLHVPAIGVVAGGERW